MFPNNYILCLRINQNYITSPYISVTGQPPPGICCRVFEERGIKSIGVWKKIKLSYIRMTTK